MKVLKLRKKLAELGLVLLAHGDGWMVTNEGTVKTLTEVELADLGAVETWLQAQLHATNRLTDVEADEFDCDWKKFVAEHGSK